MELSLDAMEIALRVLKAVNERRSPEQADIDGLCALGGSPLSTTPVDEMACDVIRKALIRRAAIRSGVKGVD